MAVKSSSPWKNKGSVLVNMSILKDYCTVENLKMKKGKL